MMKVKHLFAAVATGLTLVGCASSSSKPETAGPARSDVMDLSDAPPAPIKQAPAAVADAPAPAAESPAAATGPRKHVVEKKDTLYALAKTYYGDSKRWPEIVKANPGLVPAHMPVGKTILIP